jgi:hypothetical protein
MLWLSALPADAGEQAFFGSRFVDRDEIDMSDGRP